MAPTGQMWRSRGMSGFLVTNRVARWFFQTQNPYLGKCWRALKWKIQVYFAYGHLEYFTVIWLIIWLFGYVVVIWYIFPRFGILHQEKSGNPGHK
jgi:hypothetical protein